MEPSDGFIVLKNFEKYQHYKDGRPLHWVKLYLSLLDDYAFCMLPDPSKWHYVGLMVLAATYNNRIPADPIFLANKLSSKSVNVSILVDAGFISYESVRNSTNPLLREEREKSREEGKGSKSPPSLRSVGKKKCPDEIPVTEEDKQWAMQNHISVDLFAETAAMIDWARGKGESRADWQATRRNWWRNAQKRNYGGSNGNGKKTKDQLTQEAAERVLNGTFVRNRQHVRGGPDRSSVSDLFGSTIEISAIEPGGRNEADD